MPKTYLEFTKKLREEIWHFPGENKTLVRAHNAYFIAAMIDLQTWVPELQINNAKVWPFCSTYQDCGRTVIDAPVGVVKRIFTIVNDDWCNRVPYNSVSFEQLNCFTEGNPNKAVSEGAEQQQGIRLADASTDYTSGDTLWRARVGVWAINRHRLYISPWLNSNEKLVVEFDGEKIVWEDTDILDTDWWDPKVEEAIKDYVQWQHYHRHTTDVMSAQKHKVAYDTGLAEIIWRFAQRTKQQAKTCCDAMYLPTAADLAADNVVEEGETVIVANVADYGDGGAAAAVVAAMVMGWNPNWGTTNGDNWYGDSLDPADFETDAAMMYRDLIYPYHSFQTPKLTSLATASAFFPAFGDHDRDPVGRLAIELALFNIPKVLRNGVFQPSTGYYSVRPFNGFVEHFMFDDGYDQDDVLVQADGNDLNSAQAVWLQTALARSTARWKIVHFGVCGYTSRVDLTANPAFTGDGTKSYAAIRRIINSLKGWGADLALMGDVHAYERFNVMGFPVINNGAGGRPMFSIGAPVPFSVKQFVERQGAGRMTITCNSLLWEFFDSLETVQDTLTLTK